MPLSKEATEGLRAAVKYNPTAAHYFLQMLRFLPLGVRYKERDRYGPLAMMISAVPQSMPITDQISLPVKNVKAFPAEKLRLCEIFNEEWLQRCFTKQELADIIEQILADIKPCPVLGEVDASTALVVTAEGTFLSHDQEMKLRIDPEH